MKLKEIVVIDDSDADRHHAHVVLARADASAQVTRFERARDALAYLADPDGCQAELVLLDIHMPEMDGFAFLAAYNPLYLRHQAHAVVVLLTSLSDRRSRERALGYSCVKQCLEKPLSTGEAKALVNLVRHGVFQADGH